MSIQDLGSIGELVAAIATVLTLAYLAIQIRQNTRMVSASVATSHRDARNESARILADNPETARIFREGLLDLTCLAKAERYQFDAIMTLSLNFWEQAHSSQDDFAHLSEANDWFLSQPGLHAWWKEFGRGSYTDSFCSAFEDVLATAHSTAQQNDTHDSA